MSRKRGADSGRNAFSAEPGENSRITIHSLNVANLGHNKVNKNDVEAVKKRVHDYFQMCIDDDMKPTLAEFALAFGVTRMAMYNWLNNGDGSRFNEDSKEYIRSAYLAINSQIEQYLIDNKANVVGAIFLAKNNFGYKDQAETVVRHELAVSKDAEQLIAESRMLLETAEGDSE